MTGPLISFSRRIATLAEEHPDRAAIIYAPQSGAEMTFSWRELESRSNRIARLLAARGVERDSMVVVALPNSPEHMLAVLAVWKLGACALPLNTRLPPSERDQLIELARPRAIVARWEDVPEVLPLARESELAGFDDSPLPDVIPEPGKAIPSGGSTGRQKIIVDPRPWAFRPGTLGKHVGMELGQVQLVAGPFYHNSPFCCGHYGLFEDQTVVVMERFDATRAADLIERYRVNFIFMAPTMMSRVARLADIDRHDLSSIQSLYHTAAPCPPWLKRRWIELVGPEHIYEAFGAAEDAGVVTNRGDEWLRHPGSLGRGYNTQVLVLGEDGAPMPSGQVGEIFMRYTDSPEPNYFYIGSPPARQTQDGYVSVGDMGWLDEDGYLYLADRRLDLIISGGENVYPAEVEAAISEHQGVRDVAVIGLPDADWGKRVHAVIEPDNLSNAPSSEELRAYCLAKLARYKVPKTFEFVAQLPRDQSGKIRRRAMVQERAGDEA